MIKTLYPCFQHWSAKGSVWMISDTHFDDADCRLMDPDWILPEEHVNILSFLTKNDTLIHLGDVGNPQYLDCLKCHKVLIMGNHDQSKKKFEPHFDEIYDGPLTIGKKLILSHEPIAVPWAFNIHGHEHNGRIADTFHLNLASNVVCWRPFDLSVIIQAGWLKDVDSIHRITIDYATGHPIKPKESEV